MDSCETNRDHVVRDLRYLKSYGKVSNNQTIYEIAEAAIAMLKEQEAVEPEVEVLNEIDRIYRCPKCHKHFFYEKQKHCDQCGQAVKWE